MRFLSKSEIKKLRKRLEYVDKDVLSELFKNYKKILVTELKDKNVLLYLHYDLPIFFERRGDDNLYPTLNLLYDYGFVFLPIVNVDSGAVPYISKGADVMAPGIVEFDQEIKKGTIVCVVNPEGYPIAIGKSLISYEDFLKLKRGKVIENVHHIKDFIWNYKKNK